MSKIRLMLVFAAVLAIAAFAVGCGDSNDSSSTPSTSSTVTTETQATTTESTTTATPTETTPSGDAVAGKTAFESKCQGCHLNGGTEAGVGPVLAGGGRSEERIRNQVINGGGGMPGGLYSGTDLDNVVAFVLSIQ